MAGTLIVPVFLFDDTKRALGILDYRTGALFS